MAPDTGAHLRINTARNVMYCLRCGYAGRWDSAILPADEPLANAGATAVSASEETDRAPAEDNAEEIIEPECAEEIPLLSPIEVHEEPAATVSEVELSGGEDESVETQTPAAGLIEGSAAVEDEEAFEEPEEDDIDEASVKNVKSQPIVIEEFHSTRKEITSAPKEEEAASASPVKGFDSGIIHIEKFPADLASEDRGEGESPCAKHEEGLAASAKPMPSIEIEEFSSVRAENAPSTAVIDASATEDVTGASSGPAEEFPQGATGLMEEGATVESDDEARKSNAVVINIEEFPVSERRRRSSASAGRSVDLKTEEDPDEGVNGNSVLSSKDASEAKGPYFAEHRTPYLHDLDTVGLPELEDEETLDGTDSAGFPEDFIYRRKGGLDTVSVEPGSNGRGVTPEGGSGGVKEEAPDTDVAPDISSTPEAPPSDKKTINVDQAASSAPVTTRRTASWMAPPANKAAPSCRMEPRESKRIIQAPGAYVPPRTPSRMDSRTHIDPAADRASTEKKGGGWVHALIFYLLIVCILAVAGFVVKPYVTDMLYAKTADPTYTPFTSEKRELALSAAQDKPSEKDARALVELVQEAELRTADLRAPEDYLVLSTDAWRGKDYHQALEDVFLGLSLDHDNMKVKATLTLRLGTIYDNMKKNEMAIEQYNKASELDPGFSWPYYYLGNLYSRTGKYKLAEKAYNKSISLDSGYAYTYNNLGNLYSKMGEHRSAVDVYKEALKLNPDYANGHYNQGIMYGKMGLFEEAEKSYKEALRSDPKHAYALNNLGILYEKAGMTKEAEESYREALKIDPDHENARFNLKKLYEKKDVKKNKK